MKAPLYTALRGGRVSWVAYFKDVNPGGASWTISERIVSISGLSTGLDFSGGWKSAAVTVEGAGEEPPAGIAEGSIVHIGIIAGEFTGDLSGVQWLWAGWITTAFVNQRYFKFEAQGILSKINKETAFIEYEAQPARDIYARWAQQAAGYVIKALERPALDPEWREAIRVAPPAKDAADLPLVCKNGLGTIGARKGTATTWESFKGMTVSASIMDGSRWSPVPSESKLYMSQNFAAIYEINRALHPTWIFAKNSSFTAKSAFPAGVVEYGILSGLTLDNPSVTIAPFNVTISDGEIHEIECKYSTRKEALYAANHDEGGSYIHANPRKVRLSVKTGPATGQSWTADSAAAIGISGLLPADGDINISEPAAELPDAVAGMGVLLPFVSFKNDLNLAFNLKVTPQRADSFWRNTVGVTSSSTAGNRYQWGETFTYCTIESEPWTEERIKTAGFLGDIGIYETSDGPTSNINAAFSLTAKDCGEVYALPLTVHSVVAYEIADPVLFPSSFECKYINGWGDEYPFNVTTGGAGEKYSLDILQGGLSGPSKKLSGNYYKVSSSKVEEQPCLMGDRLTGSTLASTGKTGLARQNYLGQLTDQEGQTVSFNWQAWQCAGDTAHAVRDDYGNQHFVFFGAGSLVNMPSAVDLSKGNRYLDTTALKIKQHARENIYMGAQIRQYKITASLAFITINPGDLVVVALPDIDTAAPHLAMVTNKDASTGSGTINLVVALMDKTENLALERFPNIQNVLNQI